MERKEKAKAFLKKKAEKVKSDNAGASPEQTKARRAEFMERVKAKREARKTAREEQASGANIGVGANGGTPEQTAERIAKFDERAAAIKAGQRPDRQGQKRAVPNGPGTAGYASAADAAGAAE